MTPVPVTLIRGDDPALVAQATRSVIDRLVAGGDPSLTVEEFGGPGADPVEVGAVVDACTTPPFLVERRVVVLRDAGQLTSADAKRLTAYLEDPLPTTDLVLVAGGGTLPASLAKVAGSQGEVVDTAVGRGRARSQWFADRVKAGPVRLDATATARLADHLGDDAGRLAGLLQSLASAYGEGAAVSVEELEPFLGEAGSVAPWDLTDAIDGGDTRAALGVLRRMSGAGDVHPLVVMSLLYRHYRQMLRLDGSDATSPEAAAELLGLRSSYPAKKALTQSRRLGSARIGRAMALLAEADLALRGTTLLPGDAVLEVLVARLSRLPKQGRG
jgi:DNA polymerase III subunit delta